LDEILSDAGKNKIQVDSVFSPGFEKKFEVIVGVAEVADGLAELRLVKGNLDFASEPSHGVFGGLSRTLPSLITEANILPKKINFLDTCVGLSLSR
jgi:hypothetical protein